MSKVDKIIKSLSKITKNLEMYIKDCSSTMSNNDLKINVIIKESSALRLESDRAGKIKDNINKLIGD